MGALPKILSWLVQPSDSLPLALWDAGSIAAATGGRASSAFQAAGVEIDSRDVVEGDLFFALKGRSVEA